VAHVPFIFHQQDFSPENLSGSGKTRYYIKVMAKKCFDSVKIYTLLLFTTVFLQQLG
jgi:hypothetical protein